MKLSLESARIAVIGLGYVGLPLAVEFGKYFPTLGFDIASSRIAALRKGQDATEEVTAEELQAAKQLELSADAQRLGSANVYIVTVPTPIDGHNRPDLSPLRNASHLVGQAMSKGDVVIFESTVFPGATEEECVPILEEVSGLVFNQDFYAGYSPERINPGDKQHRLPAIMKVTSGSTVQAGEFIDALYAKIITAGTYLAPSIKVAEAAKVIENTQRDLNIALVNELSKIFERVGIDTLDVLEAAGTKWNFLPFRPGLVGGHCIGVDPFYLTHKAQELGYHPEVVLAGRRINDSMAQYFATRFAQSLIQKGINPNQARILVLGLAFKEDCPDLRNTKVVDMIDELRAFNLDVDCYDPVVNPQEADDLLGQGFLGAPPKASYDGIILAVPHSEFRGLQQSDLKALLKEVALVADLKGLFPKEWVDLRP